MPKLTWVFTGMAGLSFCHVLAQFCFVFDQVGVYCYTCVHFSISDWFVCHGLPCIYFSIHCKINLSIKHFILWLGNLKSNLYWAPCILWNGVLGAELWSGVLEWSGVKFWSGKSSCSNDSTPLQYSTPKLCSKTPLHIIHGAPILLHPFYKYIPTVVSK